MTSSGYLREARHLTISLRKLALASDRAMSPRKPDRRPDRPRLPSSNSRMPPPAVSVLEISGTTLGKSAWNSLTASKGRPYRHRTVSPDSDAIFRLQIELGSRRDLVRFVPGVHIAHRVTPVFPRWMSVGCDLLAQRSFTLNLAPSLGEGQEEPLITSQSTYHHIRLAF